MWHVYAEFEEEKVPMRWDDYADEDRVASFSTEQEAMEFLNAYYRANSIAPEDTLDELIRQSLIIEENDIEYPNSILLDGLRPILNKQKYEYVLIDKKDLK